LRMWIIPVENKQADEETRPGRSTIAWPSARASLEFDTVPVRVQILQLMQCIA
jgi:hypothetical protein